MSDQIPPPTRRPGELIFALLLTAGCIVLLWQAWNIAGPSRLSAARSVPVAATAIMVAAMLVVLVQTLRRPSGTAHFRIDILPGHVVLIAGLLVAYAVVLRPLGFLPTSFLFLTLSIRLLGKGSWARAGLIAALSVLGVWIIFRLIFTVLMPQGIFPEAQIVQMLRDLAPWGGR